MVDTNVNSVCGGDRNKGKYSGARREGGMGTTVREGIRVRGTSGRDQMELRDGAMWGTWEPAFQAEAPGRGLLGQVVGGGAPGPLPGLSTDYALPKRGGGEGREKGGIHGTPEGWAGTVQGRKDTFPLGVGEHTGTKRVSSGRDRRGPGFQKERRS